MKNFASPEQLFYNLTDGYFAYVPKGKGAEGQTLQSRNSLIGQYTEKWSKDFFQPIASELSLFAVNSVVCPELGLTTQSDADLAFCSTNETQQKAKNIKLLFEIKMSIVNNFKFESDKIEFIGDYKTHKGSPSILRSDSMLKAIGKSINIRVSGKESTKIPIIILGNSPITKSYFKKVDFLKKAGIIQSFISVYPKPTLDYIKKTDDVQLGMMVEIVKEYGNEIPKIIKAIKDKHIKNDEKEKAEMIFSTVHRSKGMEYDAIQIVNDFINEEKLEKIKIDHQEKADLSKLNEEINLLYVAITRTRNSIHIPQTLMPKEILRSSQIHIMRVESKEENREKEILEVPKTGLKDSIIEKAYSVDQIRTKHKEAYKPWTTELDDELTVMYCEGVNVRDIAKHFGRTKGAIRSRIIKLELEEKYG